MPKSCATTNATNVVVILLFTALKWRYTNHDKASVNTLIVIISMFVYHLQQALHKLPKLKMFLYMMGKFIVTQIYCFNS